MEVSKGALEGTKGRTENVNSNSIMKTNWRFCTYRILLYAKVPQSACMTDGTMVKSYLGNTQIYIIYNVLFINVLILFFINVLLLLAQDKKSLHMETSTGSHICIFLQSVIISRFQMLDVLRLVWRRIS